MKILLLHNRYQLQGGEDGVVQAEKSLLESYGHQVFLLEVDNHDIKNILDKALTGFNAIYSHSSKAMVNSKISEFRPDIVHVHNFFPLLSPSIYDACKFHQIPVVQTLHNYRLACPKAMPFRDGEICENCIGKTVQVSSVIHGCYRNSHLQSAVVMTMNAWHRIQHTWQEKVDAYIVFTNFQKEKMIQAGLPADKFHIKPNFVFNEQFYQDHEQDKKYLIFVGRLSAEKGVSVLIDAYIQQNISIPLKIVGDGPLRKELEAKVVNSRAKEWIAFLGFQDKNQVLNLMNQALFLVFPSIWYEGFPLTIAEAFACGLPVIAPKLGSMAEIIEDRVTGLHYTPGDSVALAKTIIWAKNHPQDMINMGKNAQLTYQSKYTPAANYHQLINIYEQVINQDV
ncbi:glycosyl transferase, group 1 [Richelia sinica FACHB-800]|uniref:Glycosyl transferase, group 1 n=1 Tax=Richelia sinica FACHB-800 TaxID=1357546 RepID=A0A975T6V0_9NOST|nr:glycosyltransferase family 4 protein [Richelia sinica]MBD2664229.1 glycosyltransferase family 4 protein [Richelia sinica FACHB-800]QXE22547.1 glycosyl transferase, group 1 [Richelia sinica FACHB-800]